MKDNSARGGGNCLYSYPVFYFSSSLAAEGFRMTGAHILWERERELSTRPAQLMGKNKAIINVLGAEKGRDDPRLQHSLEIFVEMSLIRREKRERESYFLIFFEERKINNLPSEDSKVSNLTDWGKKVSGRIEGENEGEKKGGGMEKSERKLTLFPIREWRVRLNIHNIGVIQEALYYWCLLNLQIKFLWLL